MTGLGQPFDVVAVGSAIVDLLVPAEPSVVASAGLVPGTMTLIDGAEADRLWGHLGRRAGEAEEEGRAAGEPDWGQMVAGGSAANTVVGVAALGGRAALVGRVADDPLGRAYIEDLRRVGVTFAAASSAPAGPEGTGRCFIVVTPDGERTMRTFLGASAGLDASCVDATVVDGTGFVYLEGYLWDAPPAAAALRRAVGRAAATGTRVALTLSDPGCVERHRDEFVEMLRSGAVDTLFANESEITGLWGLEDMAEAAERTRPHCRVAALTRGGEGSLVVSGEETVAVPAAPADVVDTTGAGDLYAAGFMLGLQRGLALEGCARLGGLAAADIISALGARPHGDIRAAAAAEGLL